MKPFAFRWERMLRLAQGFERDRRNALATAVGRLTRAEGELTDIRGKRQALMEKRSNLLSKGAYIEEVRDNYQGELAVEVRIKAQETVIEKCEGDVTKRREELTARMRERKTYEILREREWERYSLDAGHEESRVVDDIAAIAFERTQDDETGGSHEG
jgi:flagellar FliJ protein